MELFLECLRRRFRFPTTLLSRGATRSNISRTGIAAASCFVVSSWNTWGVPFGAENVWHKPAVWARFHCESVVELTAFSSRRHQKQPPALVISCFQETFSHRSHCLVEAAFARVNNWLCECGVYLAATLSHFLLSEIRDVPRLVFDECKAQRHSVDNVWPKLKWTHVVGSDGLSLTKRSLVGSGLCILLGAVHHTANGTHTDLTTQKVVTESVGKNRVSFVIEDSGFKPYVFQPKFNEEVFANKGFLYCVVDSAVGSEEDADSDSVALCKARIRTLVLNTHLSTQRSVAWKQLAQLLFWCHTLRRAHGCDQVLVCGDFNLELSDDHLAAFVEELHLRPVFHPKASTHLRNFRKIDHVLHWSKNGQLSAIRGQLQKNDLNASDHSWIGVCFDSV